jgi:hypothetical protein
MDKQTLVNVTVRLVINHSEDTDIDEVLDNMDYNFVNNIVPGAQIVDTEIMDYDFIEPDDCGD